LSRRDIASAHAGHCFDVVRLLLQDLTVNRARCRRVACVKSGLRLFHGIVDRCGASGRFRHLDQALDERLDLTFRDGAHKPVDGAALEEGIDGGNRLDTHLLCNLRRLVDVQFDETH
jgi:hypothetical protein